MLGFQSPSGFLILEYPLSHYHEKLHAVNVQFPGRRKERGPGNEVGKEEESGIAAQSTKHCGLEIMQYLALKAKTIDAFLVVFKAALLCLSLCTRSVFSDEGLEAVCPQRETAFPWNDPNDVDKRIWKLASQE